MTPTPEQNAKRAEITAWLKSKLTDTMRAVEAREQAAKTFRSGTDEEWRAASDIHPSTAGKTMSKAERERAAASNERIVVKLLHDVAILRATIAMETELAELRQAADGMREALKELLTFHPEDAESGAELPRECWTPKYAQAVDGVTDSLARYRALAGEGK